MLSRPVQPLFRRHVATTARAVLALVLCAFVLAAAPSNVGAQAGDDAAPPPLLGNTTDVADEDVGALAFIQTTYSGQSQGSFTGTLVAPTWVLTAAHCVQLEDAFGNDRHASRVEVMLGSNDSDDYNLFDLPAGVELHDAVGWVIHGNYDGLQILNDVALIKLPRPSNQPVMGIATDESLVNASGGERLAATAYGFGQNCSRPPCANDTLLRTGPTEIVSDEAAESFIGRIDERMKRKVNFLLPETSTQAGICFGDSGGPLTVMQNGVEVVAGVNSFIADADGDRRTCQPSFSGVYLNGVADVVASSLHDYVTQVLDAPTLICFDRTVTLVGTSFPDKLIGTSVVNVMHGRGDDDTLIGSRGADRLCGGLGVRHHQRRTRRRPHQRRQERRLHRRGSRSGHHQRWPGWRRHLRRPGSGRHRGQEGRRHHRRWRRRRHHQWQQRVRHLRRRRRVQHHHQVRALT